MSSALVINWKEEPLSPANDNVDETSASLFSEDTFYQTCLGQDHIYCNNNDIKFEDDLVPNEIKEEIALHMLEDIEKLIDLDELIKDEYLLDEKILPILDEVEQPRAIEVPMSQIKMEYARSQDTSQYFNEFDVYVELGHETLTPPQSPPNQSPVLTPLEPLLTPSIYPLIPTNVRPESTLYPVQQVPEKQQLLTSIPEYRPLSASTPISISLEYPPVNTPQPDIARELAVVDELVRTRVEDMQWSSGPSSPNSNSSCSGSSNFGDCSSDDPEWVPEPIENFDENAGGPIKSPRKRSKPYSRSSQVDKKSRKKEQNKNAATRYRMKKKAEVEVILSEEKQLSDHNDDLEHKINDMQREIKYLKGLMRDLFKAKGLIN